MVDQLTQHRDAYQALMVAFPDANLIEHRGEWGLWVQPQIKMSLAPRCPTCGDRQDVVGLTVKCRDWHEVCQCGARFDQSKNPGCRRRKHPKAEKP